MSDESSRERAPRSLIVQHPVISAVLLTCTLAGLVAGPFLLTEEWSLLRRVAAGGFAGAGVGLLLTATKMM